MTQYDLSILIPARNEMFLAKTIEDLIENKRGKTEIIAVLDGAWAEPGIEDHPDVTVIYHSESIGQRAATNEAARLSRAKYVMKVDAHCAFDEGFDVKLLADMQDDWTMAPTMRNLHAFNWVCPDGHTRYQGRSGPCLEDGCGKDTVRDVVWIAKKSPQSTSYRFDKDLHFQYFGEYKKKQKGQLVESMSLQGSFFLLTREKYWELNICDEGHGSWGQQGTEVACKTWLSGGRVIINKNTWYAHMFRTQGGDFGFPYPNPGVQKARDYSKKLWLENNWPLAIHKLDWLTNKFKAPDWYVKAPPTPAPGGLTKGIIFYTDNKLNLKIAHRVQRQLKRIELPIVSVSLKPMTFGKNTCLPLKRGHLTMFKQILTALETSTEDIVYFCEHDVMYHPAHFDFVPENAETFYYNTNVWKIRDDGLALWVNNCRQVSGICVHRLTAIQHYKERIAYVEEHGFQRKMGFEPGTHDRVAFPTRYTSSAWHAKYPNLDIRHNNNLTRNRWSPDQFRDKRNCQGWKETTVDKIDGWEEMGSVSC